MATILVGYRRFTSKKNGKDYCMANVVQDVSLRDKENGMVGQKVDTLYMPEEKYDLLKPEHIGKELDLSYELSGGRAYLVDVSLKK